MSSLRLAVLDQRGWAALLLGATLLLRLLVPSGFMLDRAGGAMVLELCSGSGPMAAMAMDAPAASMSPHAQHGAEKAGKADMPCAFSGLAADALGGVDPVLLVALVAFIMGLGRVPVLRPALVRRAYLRPPLRGPPAFS